MVHVLDDEVTPACGDNVVAGPSQLPSVATAPAAPPATVPSSLLDIQLMINQALEEAFLSSSAFIKSIDLSSNFTLQTSAGSSLQPFVATTRVETCSSFLNSRLAEGANLLDDAFFHIQYCITQESIHNNQMDYGTIIDVVGKTICRWKNYSSDCERQRHSGVYYPRNPRGCTCTSSSNNIFRALATIMHYMDCVKTV